jgi:membrane protease YdiL (CAAX protease family)
METINLTAPNIASGLARLWQRIPVLIKAIILGFLVNTVGVMAWPIVGTLLPLPVALIVMIGLLFLYWKYFSGSWGSKATVIARKTSFRATRLSSRLWRWSLLAGGLFVLIFQSGLVVTFRLIDFPAEAFTQGTSFYASLSPLMTVGVIIMTSLVAGICEETGFRGYAQVPLEKRYGPLAANVVVSLFFVAAHLQQAWSGPLLIHIFLASMLFGLLAQSIGSLIPVMIAHTVTDIINFSYWWSDFAGKFEYDIISRTGIDAHFITWVLILVAAVILFSGSIRKIKQVRRSE